MIAEFTWNVVCARVYKSSEMEHFVWCKVHTHTFLKAQHNTRHIIHIYIWPQKKDMKDGNAIYDVHRSTCRITDTIMH